MRMCIRELCSFKEKCWNLLKIVNNDDNNKL